MYLLKFAVIFSFVFGLGWNSLANAQQPTEISLIRTLFGETSQTEPREILAGPPQTMGQELWLASGALWLRVESPSAGPRGVIRFRPMPDAKGELQLQLMILTQPGVQDDALLNKSNVIHAGILTPARTFSLQQGLETELTGQTGKVSQVVIQDDGSAEIRLEMRGEVLVVQVVTPTAGGDPAEQGPPAYLGENLRFMDYDFMLGGYTDNIYLEWGFWRELALKVNNLSGGGTALATRLVVQKEVVRGNRFSLWLEGGGGLYQFSPTPEDDPDHKRPVWVFGTTGHYRRGDWGAAVHLGLLKSQSLYMIMGSWQAVEWISFFLGMQSFSGLSGYALGAAVDF